MEELGKDGKCPHCGNDSFHWADNYVTCLSCGWKGIDIPNPDDDWPDYGDTKEN